MARRSSRSSRRSEEDLLEVTVLRSGGRPVRVEVEEGSTVEEAVEDAGFAIKPRDEVTLNGDTLSSDEYDTTLEHLDTIKIIPKFQGGKK